MHVPACLSLSISVSVSICAFSCLAVCPPVPLCQTICPAVSLSSCLSSCLSVKLSVCLSICLSACQTVCLPNCLPAKLSACQTVCLPSCLSSSHLSLSICLPVWECVKSLYLCGHSSQLPHMYMQHRPQNRLIFMIESDGWIIFVSTTYGNEQSSWDRRPYIIPLPYPGIQLITFCAYAPPNFRLAREVV